MLRSLTSISKTRLQHAVLRVEFADGALERMRRTQNLINIDSCRSPRSSVDKLNIPFKMLIW